MQSSISGDKSNENSGEKSFDELENLKKMNQELQNKLNQCAIDNTNSSHIIDLNRIIDEIKKQNQRY